jgi:ligand-binding SRPBCC domain-containing protein
MRQFLFASEIWLPRTLTEVFPFFADAGNLDLLTPPWLRFEILTPPPIEMKVGALIDYRLRLRRWPIRWRTRITEWQPPVRFVDEQLRGPYRQWIHEHTFAERDGGTLVGDRVRYAVPGGALVNALFVRRDIERIFAHRRSKLQEVFR